MRITAIQWAPSDAEVGALVAHRLARVFAALPGGSAAYQTPEPPQQTDFMPVDDEGCVVDREPTSDERYAFDRAHSAWERVVRRVADDTWANGRSIAEWARTEFDRAKTMAIADLGDEAHPVGREWRESCDVPASVIALVTPTSGRIVWRDPETGRWGVWFGPDGSLCAAGQVLADVVDAYHADITLTP